MGSSRSTTFLYNGNFLIKTAQLFHNTTAMATATNGRKSKLPARGKVQARSLKRKRETDEYEALQKGVDELVSDSRYRDHRVQGANEKI